MNLRELAAIYRVKKEGNPFHAKDGKFTSKDSAETAVMDVAHFVKNKKMTDKDWEKVNEIGLDLTDSDIVDLERGGVEKIDEMVKNQLKENEELLSKTTDKDAKDLLIKQIAKLKQYSKTQKSELLSTLATIYRVKKAGNPFKDERGQFTSKEKAKTIAEWWNEGGKEKTGGALGGLLLGSGVGGTIGGVSGVGAGALAGAGIGALAGGVGAPVGAAVGGYLGGAIGELSGTIYGGYKGFKKGKQYGESHYAMTKRLNKINKRLNREKENSQKSELLKELVRIYA